jgi:hypothetical protein
MPTSAAVAGVAMKARFKAAAIARAKVVFNILEFLIIVKSMNKICVSVLCMVHS